MKIRLGIMGFGRIGRNVFRILHPQNEIEIVGIADIADPEAMAYLLQYDTVHGKFPEDVSAKDDCLIAGSKKVPVIHGKEPGDIDWKKVGADIVLEATGKYRAQSWLQKHVEAGAKRVILTGPSDDDVDAVVIRGINDDILTPEHQTISASSITANCVSLILKILDQEFGVDRAFMTTIHAYTNDSRLADVPHSDLRRSRAAAENIIPTDTLVPRAVERVLPKFKGRIEGIAMNVPVPDGSNVDLTAEMKRDVTSEKVNAAILSATKSHYKGLLDYVNDPIVSSDVIGDTHSAIFDGLATQVIGGKLLKTVSWYDNGWGYANRVVEIVKRLAEFGDPS